MSTQVAGNVNQYINLVGQSGETVKAEVQHIIDTSGCTLSIREVDEDFLGYGSTESYWSLHAAGLEFHWKNDLLSAATLFTQEQLFGKYSPYSQPLFDNFSNTATRDEIIQNLSKPAREGKWKQSWIRYNNPNGTWINFEFDSTLHLRMVMVCMPVN